MKLTLDFTIAAIIFLAALALTIYTLAQTTLPPPTPTKPAHQPLSLEIKGNTITADKVVRIWIVAIDPSGSYTATETNTPASLPRAQFVAVFTGNTVVYKGTLPPSLNGYICRRGIVDRKPLPPYIYVEDGKIVEVVSNH